jgi:hypothetical protein
MSEVSQTPGRPGPASRHRALNRHEIAYSLGLKSQVRLTLQEGTSRSAKTYSLYLGIAASVRPR